jgi:hypothetical protein
MVNFEKYQKVFNGVGVSLGDFSKFTKIVRFLTKVLKIFRFLTLLSKIFLYLKTRLRLQRKMDLSRILKFVTLFVTNLLLT